MPEDPLEYVIPPTAKEIDARLAELGRQRADIDYEINGLRQRLAELSTELRLGDRVIYREEEFELSAILPGYNPRDPKIMGRKIKKDGTPSIAERELYGYGKFLTRAPRLAPIDSDPAGKAPGEC